MRGTLIGGPHPDTGRHFTIGEPQVGRWGGSAFRDGASAQFNGFHGHTFNSPPRWPRRGGLSLVRRGWAWDTGWVDAGLAGLAVLLVAGAGLVGGPRVRSAASSPAPGAGGG